jgi:hypothetical protein
MARRGPLDKMPRSNGRTRSERTREPRGDRPAATARAAARLRRRRPPPRSDVFFAASLPRERTPWRAPRRVRPKRGAALPARLPGRRRGRRARRRAPRRLLDASRSARHRAALAGSGIAGTTIPYRSSTPRRSSSRRLSRQLEIDWERRRRRLRELLLEALGPAESVWLRNAIRRCVALSDLAGSGRSKADFLVERIEAMPGDSFTREASTTGSRRPTCCALA